MKTTLRLFMTGYLLVWGWSLHAATAKILAPYKQFTGSMMGSELADSPIDVATDGTVSYYYYYVYDDVSQAYRYVLEKYDDAGERLWQHELVFEWYTYLGNMTLGEDGSLYLWGETTANLTTVSENDGSNYDTAVVRIDPEDGQTLWTAQYGINGINEYPVDVAADANGTLYAIGTDYAADSQALFLSRIEPSNGETIWKRTFTGWDENGSNFIDPLPDALAFGPGGRVLFAASVNPDGDFDLNPETAGATLVVQHDGEGYLEWMVQTGTRDDVQQLLAVDSENRVHLVSMGYNTGVWDGLRLEILSGSDGSSLSTEYPENLSGCYPEIFRRGEDASLYLLGSCPDDSDVDGDSQTSGRTFLMGTSQNGMAQWFTQLDLGNGLPPDVFVMGMDFGFDMHHAIRIVGQGSSGIGSFMTTSSVERSWLINQPAGKAEVIDLEAYGIGADPVFFSLDQGVTTGALQIDPETGALRFIQPPVYHGDESLDTYKELVVMENGADSFDAVEVEIRVVPAQPVSAAMPPLLYLLQ